jgi:hypothetical protein
MIAALLLAAFPSGTPEPLAGYWINPAASAIVEIAPCGANWCGTVACALEGESGFDARRDGPADRHPAHAEFRCGRARKLARDVVCPGREDQGAGAAQAQRRRSADGHRMRPAARSVQEPHVDPDEEALKHAVSAIFRLPRSAMAPQPLLLYPGQRGDTPMADGNMQDRLDAVGKLMAMFQPERIAYLVTAILSLAMILYFGFQAISRDPTISTLVAIGGGGGLISIGMGRLLTMWSMAMRLIAGEKLES